MTVYVGPTNWWWKDSPDASINCKVKGTLKELGELGLGTALPDGSTIMCASNGLAILVAPSCTQVSEPWGNVTACGSIDNSPAGVSVHSDITSENWPVLYSQLISCGFNPCEWFVPSKSQLQLGYQCKTNWDPSPTVYWSSTEVNATWGCNVLYTNGGSCTSCTKTRSCCVRAFRCVTY